MHGSKILIDHLPLALWILKMNEMPTMPFAPWMDKKSKEDVFEWNSAMNADHNETHAIIHHLVESIMMIDVVVVIIGFPLDRPCWWKTSIAV